MLKKLRIIFKVLIITSLFLSVSKAEILKPNSDIKPSEVVKIQLNGLKKNNLNFEDSGIEQLLQQNQSTQDCSTETLTIENTITHMKADDLGEDDDYNLDL